MLITGRSPLPSTSISRQTQIPIRFWRRCVPIRQIRSLPIDVVNYGVTVQKSTTAPLMLVNLYSPKGTYDNIFLANYSYINLNDQLTRVPGVASVTVFGAGQYAMRCWVRPDKLAKMASYRS